MCRSLHKTSVIQDTMRMGRDWPLMPTIRPEHPFASHNPPTLRLRDCYHPLFFADAYSVAAKMGVWGRRRIRLARHGCPKCLSCLSEPECSAVNGEGARRRDGVCEDGRECTVRRIDSLLVQCRSQDRDARPERIRIREVGGRRVQVNRGRAIPVDDSQRPVSKGFRGGCFIEEGEHCSCFVVWTAAKDIVDSSYHCQKAILVRRAQRSRGRGRKVCRLAHELKSDFALNKVDLGWLVVVPRGPSG